MLGFPILSRNGQVAERCHQPKPKLRTCNLPLLVMLWLPQWVVRAPAASFYNFFALHPEKQLIEPLVTWIFIRVIRCSSGLLIRLHVGRDPTIHRRPAVGSAFDARTSGKRN
jgi:hypothetical protein